jgi:hypothetical protein
MGLAVWCGSAQARKDRPPAAPEQAATPKISWTDCRQASPEITPAVDAARRLLEQSWLASRETLFAAYTMPGETRNPFDLSPREADSGPVGGIVEARPPRCLHHTPAATAGTSGETHLVRFVAPFYRFHEAGDGWSPPLRDGLMLDAVVTRTGDAWQANAAPSEVTILIPEQSPRRADAAKLPADAPWARPIPGCTKRQRWNGIDCVRAKR